MISADDPDRHDAEQQRLVLEEAEQGPAVARVDEPDVVPNDRHRSALAGNSEISHALVS